MATLPSLTRVIDNAFTTTWYEIREQAIDNVLDAVAVWAALVGAGTMTPQVGSKLITRTIRYGEQDAVDVERGDTLPSGEPALETMAIWKWRYMATHVQRTVFDDQENAGPSKVKDLVGMKLGAARDGIEQRLESLMWGTFNGNEDGAGMQSLNDLIPPLASRETGEYGGIARPLTYTAVAGEVEDPATGNTYWGGKYLDGTKANRATEMLNDMTQLYNALHANQTPPNLILMSVEAYEIYEADWLYDKIQIIQDETTRLANLGFEVQRFKGKPMLYTAGANDDVVMLNTDFMEIVYDPNLWFEMTDWKPIPLEPSRIAHIMSAVNLIGTQPRRNGRIVYV